MKIKLGALKKLIIKEALYQYEGPSVTAEAEVDDRYFRAQVWYSEAGNGAGMPYRKWEFEVDESSIVELDEDANEMPFNGDSYEFEKKLNNALKDNASDVLDDEIRDYKRGELADKLFGGY